MGAGEGEGRGERMGKGMNRERERERDLAKAIPWVKDRVFFIKGLGWARRCGALASQIDVVCDLTAIRLRFECDLNSPALSELGRPSRTSREPLLIMPSITNFVSRVSPQRV